jgi:hypothetical protein
LFDLSPASGLNLGAKVQKKFENTKTFVHNFTDKKNNPQEISHLCTAQNTQFIQTILAAPLPPSSPARFVS